MLFRYKKFSQGLGPTAQLEDSQGESQQTENNAGKSRVDSKTDRTEMNRVSTMDDLMQSIRRSLPSSSLYSITHARAEQKSLKSRSKQHLDSTRMH